METITVRMRLEYYWKLYMEVYGRECAYPEFIESLCAKLEQEIRDKTSKLDGYQIIKPKTIGQEEFNYDYS